MVVVDEVVVGELFVESVLVVPDGEVSPDVELPDVDEVSDDDVVVPDVDVVVPDVEVDCEDVVDAVAFVDEDVEDVDVDAVHVEDE